MVSGRVAHRIKKAHEHGHVKYHEEPPRIQGPLNLDYYWSESRLTCVYDFPEPLRPPPLLGLVNFNLVRRISVIGRLRLLFLPEINCPVRVPLSPGLSYRKSRHN